jgi:accessory colonization factor AcfC
MGRARSVLILALLVIATTRETPVARRLVLASLGDAYIQVSAFVAFLKSASGEAVFKKWGWRR